MKTSTETKDFIENTIPPLVQELEEKLRTALEDGFSELMQQIYTQILTGEAADKLAENIAAACGGQHNDNTI